MKGTNLPGGHRCSCGNGLVVSRDAKSCEGYVFTNINTLTKSNIIYQYSFRY